MATPDQIKTVKTIRKRLTELLGDSKVTVTVSYTSSTDILRLTFKKLLKGAAFELPICTSMKEYLLNPETLQYIVTDALAKMPQPPKWSAMTLLTELRRRYDAYCTYMDFAPNLLRPAAIGAHFTSAYDATQVLYSVCGGATARTLTQSSSDLDLVESMWERDAGIVSNGEYTRWRETGEPKRYTDAQYNGVAPAVNHRTFSWAEVVQNIGPIGVTANYQPMQYYTFDSLGGQLAAPPTQESTNE